MKTKQIKYIWEVSRGQRGRILLSCLTGIIGVAVSLAFIYASKVVIDIATGAAIGSLTNAAILTIALLIAQLLCGAVDIWLSTHMQVETGNALRHRLFSRLLQSRWNELERFHTGDIVNRVEQDTASIVELLTSTIPAFIVTIVQLIAAFVFFCFLDPSLPWVVAGMICKMHSVVRYSVVPAFHSLHVCWWHLRSPAAILQHSFGVLCASAQAVSPSEQ